MKNIDNLSWQWSVLANSYTNHLTILPAPLPPPSPYLTSVHLKAHADSTGFHLTVHYIWTFDNVFKSGGTLHSTTTAWKNPFVPKGFLYFFQSCLHTGLSANMWPVSVSETWSCSIQQDKDTAVTQPFHCLCSCTAEIKDFSFLSLFKTFSFFLFH